MQNPRRLARIAALQGLYQLDLQREGEPLSLDDAMVLPGEEVELTSEMRDYARELVRETWAAREKYDGMITEVSKHWDVARMLVVDRHILRLALNELLERLDTPPRVIIDEAIEIGRDYGTKETPQFVNGVLDAIYKKHPSVRVARGEDQK